MKLAFVIRPSRVWISSITREPEALRDPALDLALDRLRVDRPADLLRGADPDDARQAELDVDLGDDPHRRDGERDVRALAGDLAGLGIERRRRQVAVDRSTSTSPPPRASRSASAARQASRTAPETIQVWRDAEVEPAESTVAVDGGASRTSSIPSSVRATWRITFETPWPTSAAAQCTSAEPSASSRTRAAQ